jgi:hypothetical protein
VKVEFHDFNGADAFFGGELIAEWQDLVAVLSGVALQLKPSDQAGKQGKPIFDPVASNAVIKSALEKKGWRTNIEIPAEVAFLGKDVDFFRRGVLVEAQFSNYPFFLNNVVRSALLAKSHALLDGNTVHAIAIVTKGHMFPSSNSTLYYEQALKQLAEFAKYGVFDVPVRVVGLLEEAGIPVPAVWNEYPRRYSRAPSSSRRVECKLIGGRRQNSVCTIELIPPAR